MPRCRCQTQRIKAKKRIGREYKKAQSYAYLWLIHVDVWQKPTQYCKEIILQLKINKFNLKKKRLSHEYYQARAFLRATLHGVPYIYVSVKKQTRLWPQNGPLFPSYFLISRASGFLLTLTFGESI